MSMSAMKKIVILNPKGGCGKTTLATNLASYYANRDVPTTLMDYDSQGSSMRWLRKRPDERPFIDGIAAYQKNSGVTRSWQLRVSHNTKRLILDTPAALDPQGLTEITKTAHAILVPVLPSEIDIHAASHCVRDLLLIAKVQQHSERIGIVANRVRKNTRAYKSLEIFLARLDIPFLVTLRDSQCYVSAAEQGVGIADLPPSKQGPDVAEWKMLHEWIESRSKQPLDRDMLQNQPA